MDFDFNTIGTKIGSQKKQIYLILLLIIIIFAILFLIWNYILVKPTSSVIQPLPPPEIKINFEILKSEMLQRLEPTYQEIPPLSDDEILGRDNPFIPY